MIAMKLKQPKLELEDGKLSLVRGLLRRRSIRLSEVVSIVAFTRDSYTHDRIFVQLEDGGGKKLVLSEFDENFDSVFQSLKGYFQEMRGLSELQGLPAFQEATVVLWPNSSESPRLA